MKEYFFDQGVIIGYASFVFAESEAIQRGIEKFGKLCADFIENKKEESFVTCFYIVEKDLPKFRIRRKIVLNEVRKKLQNPSYEIGSSEEAIKNLYKQDINYAKRIFSLLGLIPEKELRSLLIKIEATFSIRLDYLFKNIISKIVVPVENIDKKIVSILQEFIDNFSDCNVFASCLEYTTEIVKSRSIILDKIIEVIFTTLDIKHFNENNIAFIQQDLRLKDYNFPRVLILI